WSGWPQGRFALDVTHAQFVKEKKLLTHWPTKQNTYCGGRGSPKSDTVDGGKIKRYVCQGTIKCSNKKCGHIIRPLVDPKHQREQMDESCPKCEAVLDHYPCPSISYLIIWGQKKDDDKKYRNLNTTASQAMVGKETADGFIGDAPSCGQKFMSHPYVDHCLQKEKEESGKGRNTGFGHFRRLREWKEKHATVVCKDYTGEGVTVISVQTQWMREQAIPEDSVASETNPVSGLLSDAAHKYFNDPNAHLIATTTFSPPLQKWVPNLFSYADGATAKHYELHFITLIEGIMELARKKEIPLTDNLLLMVRVVDFSPAQRNGFTDAFVAFFLAQPPEIDNRSAEELRKAAQALLKGCEYHYHKSVTRVSRLGSIVPPETKRQFHKMCYSLVTLKSVDDFNQTVADLKEQWPKIVRWLEWWLIPEHACMIFASLRTMSPEDAAKLPSTTNAEEAMHASLYRTVGKQKELFSGLDGLLAFEKKIRLNYQTVKSKSFTLLLKILFVLTAIFSGNP
ncbi:hypothetical protein K435DRAFT_663121, partial [Dendrothele bispora CBS 962.96]